MTEEQKSRRWRPLIIVAVVGVIVIAAALAALLAVAVPARRQKIIARNETETLQTLRAITVAQDAQMANTRQYVTLQELAGAGTLNAQFAGALPVVNGYAFTLRIVPGADGQPPAYTINADPVVKDGSDATGQRHFYLDSRITGIRFNTERPATATDRPWR